MIDNTEDIVDSRDVVARISELEAEALDRYADGREDVSWGEVAEDHAAYLDDEDADELRALRALEAEAQSTPDWQYGEALIRDSYFEDYARELAEDIGAVNCEAQWPLSYIDWPAAARALQIDYIDVDFDGVTYWVRA